MSSSKSKRNLLDKIGETIRPIGETIGLAASPANLQKIILPPFALHPREESPTNESSGSGGGNTDSSWEIMPDEVEDPRFDRHGFRRDAAKLRREEAFEQTYAGRLEQQEARWARRAHAAETNAAAASDGVTSSRSELKRLVRQGIPAERRRVVWPDICRAAELRAAEPEGYFAGLLAQPSASKEQDPAFFAAERQIDLDLARTFPGHRLLSSEDGAQKLRSVLIAYARRDPRVGYVQGMGFVAALLLVFVDIPEDAFWCLCSVVEYLLPEDYYSATLLGLRTEQSVFTELLHQKLPKLAMHFTRHQVITELFATRWFVALFANALPIETTLRVWDAFLLEGAKVLHRVSLALLRVAEPRLLACRDQQEILLTLQEEQANCLDCERLLSLAFDRVSFLRSFPRARVESLRRKHRARLLAAEAPSSPHHRPATKPPPGTPPSAGSVASAPASSEGGGAAGGTPAATALLRETLMQMPEEDSSDAEADDEMDAEPDEHQFDVVSFDDLDEREAAARDFWL